MRVFVTGGTGFVGSHLVECLVDKGYEPVCMVRETSDTRHLDKLGVEKAIGSMSNVDTLENVLAEVDAVVHVAGATRVRNVEDYSRVNGQATRKLAEVCARVNPGLKRFLYVSSVAAQGPSPELGPRPASLDPCPVSFYGESKLEGERGVLDFVEHIPVTILRPPAVYGPRDYAFLEIFKVLKFGVAPVYGNGDHAVSVVHVLDLVDAMVRLLEHSSESGKIFTVDDGKHYSWTELCNHIATAMGTRARRVCVPHAVFATAAFLSENLSKVTGNPAIFSMDKFTEMQQQYWICGHEALRNELDWTPAWLLEEGARQTAQWYRENGWI